jgi:hypothetical protein
MTNPRWRLALVALGLLAACQQTTATEEPTPNAPDTAALEQFCRTSAPPLQVCEQLHKLRVKKTPTAEYDEGCLLRMITARDLDGPKLWPLRARCISSSASLDEAYRCNSMHHRDWPKPARIGKCPRPHGVKLR